MDTKCSSSNHQSRFAMETRFTIKYANSRFTWNINLQEIIRLFPTTLACTSFLLIVIASDNHQTLFYICYVESEQNLNHWSDQMNDFHLLVLKDVLVSLLVNAFSFVRDVLLADRDGVAFAGLEPATRPWCRQLTFGNAWKVNSCL